MMTPHSLVIAFLLACLITCNGPVDAFLAGNGVIISAAFSRRRLATAATTTTNHLHLAATNTRSSSSISLSLPKPLGLILEEVEKGKSCGVFVASVADVGSAVPHAKQIVGTKLLSVQGQAVMDLDLDSVMDKIINTPTTALVELVFDRKQQSDDNSDESSSSSGSPTNESFAIGTSVKIVVLNGSKDGKSDLEINNAKVGDNLRQTLLDNGFEVYQGIKQKLGNCGGAGQCTFCAMDFLECSEGWLERSDYEDSKLGKRNPKARLACINNIQGPATIQKAQR